MKTLKQLSVITTLCFFIFFGCTKKSTDCQGTACTPKSFTLFNSIHFSNTPDLSSANVHNFFLFYSNHLDLKDPNNPSNVLPYPDSIFQVASRCLAQPTIPVSLDIESWSYAPAYLDSTVSWYLQVLAAFRQVNKSSMVGYYGVVPNDAYTWKNIQPSGSANYIKWQNLNSTLSPIAGKVDIFFPSFYTFDNDTASWKSFVNATIEETRKYNRKIPIYAYLWPQYHDGTPLQFQFVDTTVWKYELETIYSLADGIVIWTGNKDINKQPVTWDASMPWWIATQLFIREHGIQ